MSAQKGLGIWHDETRASVVGAADTVPYTALLPLVGLYLLSEVDKPTSRSWRSYVLNTPSAMQGLLHSLHRWRHDLVEVTEVPIVDIVPEATEGIAGQHQRTNESLCDGLPTGQISMPWNEFFLAKHLGLAIHDDAVRLQPLRVLDQGNYSISQHFPKTAQYIEGLS